MLNLGVDLEPGDTPGPAKGAHEALGESVLNPGVTWNLGDLEPGGTPDPAKGVDAAPLKSGFALALCDLNFLTGLVIAELGHVSPLLAAFHQ